MGRLVGRLVGRSVDDRESFLRSIFVAVRALAAVSARTGAAGEADVFGLAACRAGGLALFAGGGTISLGATSAGAAFTCGAASGEGSGLGGRLAGGVLGAASRRTPSRNSLPSLRQFWATPENCSRCHLTVSLDPTVMGVLTRMQAPDRDVSSRVPGTRDGLPLSSQTTSATAHITNLGSRLRPSMAFVSAQEERSLVTGGSGGILGT